MALSISAILSGLNWPHLCSKRSLLMVIIDAKSTVLSFYVAFNMALIHGQFVRLFRAPLLDARLANPCSA